MSEAGPSSSSCVHSDTITETDLLARTDNIVLVNSPPDYVKQISRLLTSSVEQQSGQDTNSDSGESLFITQKCAPERRTRSSQRSNFRTHIDAPQHEYDTSTSKEELEADRKQRKKSYQAPKFSFPFLKKRLIRLPYYQSRKLHYYAMGGYFRCAEQLWESYQTGEGLLPSLPTVDVDGEPISPISEVEDETMKDEHIRVVERKLFVASKAKSSQPWYNSRKRANEEMQQNHEQTNAACKISMWRPLSKGTQSSKTKESDKILGEAESIDKSVTKSRNFTAETGMGMTDRSPNKGSRASGFLFREKRKMLGNDIDAKCHGLIAEQYTGVDEQTCLGDNDDTECHRIKVKKKKKQKDRGGDNCVEEGKGLPADPSRSPIITEAEKAQDTAKKKKHEYLGQAAHGQSEEDSVLRYEAQIGCMEGRKNKKGNDDTDSVKTSKVAESTTKDGLVLKKRKKRDKDRSDSHQTPTEHPETIDHSANGKTSEETLESSGLKRKKHKKKKKKKSLCNDHRTDMNFSNSATTLAENTDFVKVKKLSEVAKLSEETQTEKQEVEPESRKKKKVKDDTSIIYPEDMLTSCDYSELVHKKNKRRNPSFLCADAEEQLASGREGRAEKREVSAGGLAADSADVSEHSLEPRGGKKKKKRSAAVPESEEREPEETPEAGVRKKKKRKRTESLPGSLESVADEGRSQTEEAVVVRKKKKNKKNKGTQEVPPAATEDPAAEKSTPGACSSLSASQKLLMEREGKHKGGGETSCDSSLSTLQQAKKTLTEGASDLHASGDVHERKKKKSADSNAPGGKPCTHTANTETRKTKTEDRTKPPADPRFTSTSPKRLPAEIETSSSQCVMGKRVRAKRRLHNPNTDFLSDL